MYYFTRLNSLLITEVVSLLSYHNLCQLLRSKIVDETKIDYKDLFYRKDTLYTDRIIKHNAQIACNGGKIVTTVSHIIYYGLKDIVEDDNIIRISNGYKILYTMMINTVEDHYISYLNYKSLIHKLDNKLYGLLIKNKSSIYKYRYEYVDEFIDLNYISLYYLYFGVEKCLRSANAIPPHILQKIDMNKDMLYYLERKYMERELDPDEENTKPPIIEIHLYALIDLYYMDNIRDITKYLFQTYKISELDEDSKDNDIDYCKSLLEGPGGKQFDKYFRHLLKVYPDNIHLFGPIKLSSMFAYTKNVKTFRYILDKIYKTIPFVKTNYSYKVINHFATFIENFAKVNESLGRFWTKDGTLSVEKIKIEYDALCFYEFHICSLKEVKNTFNAIKACFEKQLNLHKLID